jgi:Predicted transcriptional regulators
MEHTTNVRLTNVEIVLMRFIKIRPSYAYELEHIISEWKLRHWVKIGGATVYQVLNRLCKQGLLRFDTEQEGNMPVRRRYTITEKGEERLHSSVKEILKEFEPYYFDLNIGLACRQFLPKKEFTVLIQERLETLEHFMNEFNEIFEKSEAFFPDRKIAMREYLLAHYKVELEFLQKLVRSSENEHAK